MVRATVRLYGDIGLDPGFKKTMDFNSRTEQAEWFNSWSYDTVTANYNKLHNTFAINKSYGECLGYTYVMITNMDDSGRTYYGFVSNVQAVDVAITRFSIVIDPLQTFMCEWELGQCEVVRSHRPRFDSEGRIRIQYAKEPFDGEKIIYDDTTISSGLPNAVIVAFTKDFQIYDDYTRTNMGYEEYSLLRYGIVNINTSDYNTPVNQAMYFTDGDYSGGHWLPSFSLAELVSGSWTSAIKINPEAIVGAWALTHINATLRSTTYNGTTCYYFTTPSYTNVPGRRLWADETFWGQDWNAVYYTSEDVDILVTQANGSMSMDNTNGSRALQLLRTTQIMDLMSNPGSLYSYNDSYGSYNHTTELSPDNEPQLRQHPIQILNLIGPLGDSILEEPDIIRYQSEYKNSTNLTQNVYLWTLVKTTGVTQYLSFNNSSTNQYLLNNFGEYQVPAVDILSDPWLSYCLTQRSSDRAMAAYSAVSSIANGSTRSLSSGNPVGAVAGGTSAIGAVAGQIATEQVKRNEPANTLVKGDGIAMMFQPFRIAVYGIDETEYNRLFQEYTKYGNIYEIGEVPNIKSRKYFNYLQTNSCIVNGSLPANFKGEISSIFNSGITLFHYPNSKTTEYASIDNEEVDE